MIRDVVIASVRRSLPRGSTVVSGRFLVGVTRGGTAHLVADPVDSILGDVGASRISDMIAEARKHGARRFTVYAAATLIATKSWSFRQVDIATGAIS